MVSKIKGVFFDLFNTLVYGTHEAFDALIKEVEIKYNIENFGEAFHKEMKEFYSKEIMDAKFQRLHDVYGGIIGRALAKCSRKIDPRETRSLVEFFFSKVGKTPPRPEALDVLTKLRERGFILGVISNVDTQTLYKELEGANLLNLLDVVVSSEEVGAYKPSPLPFREALKRAKVTADQAIYIGDRARDILGAKGVGMITVLIGEETDQETTSVPDYAVKTLKEACELVINKLS